jgi:hypothetical protein
MGLQSKWNVLLRFQANGCFVNVPQCYVKPTLPVVLILVVIFASKMKVVRASVLNDVIRERRQSQRGLLRQ